jgi:putative Mn2+ efflux pump MntP
MSDEPADHGAEPGAESPAFLEEYWDWVAVALFLLVTVDMLTTMFAAAALGPAAEANPLMRWALGRGPATLVAMNVAAVVLAVGLFYALREMLGRTPGRYRRPFSLLVEVWLGSLVFAGLGVLANNLSAVLLGASLV